MFSHHAVAVALLWFLSVGESTPSAWRALSQAGAAGAGIWRADGYGHLLVLGPDAPVLYHVAGSYCYRDTRDTVTTDESFRLVARLSRDQLATAAEPTGTHYAFHRIAALPAACTRPRAWTRADIARVIAATFADLYPGFGPRPNDRGRFEQAIIGSPAPATDAALYQRVTQALARLDDAHVGLERDEEQPFESGEAPTILAARADPSLGSDPDAREAT